MQRILFVCTANTCRSPLAEKLFQHLAYERGVVVEARSAGVYARSGAAISQHSGFLLRERGIDERFQSTNLDESLIEWADLVLTMTQTHKYDLLQRYPQALHKIYTLKEYVLFDEQTERTMQAMDQIYAEIEMQFSLGQTVTVEQRTKLRELEKQLPNLDIVDPFAGSIDIYRTCALEIEKHLQLLLDKLQNQ